MSAAERPPLILASGSQRRRDLLQSAAIEHEIQISDVPEERRPGEAPEAFARRMAVAKATAVARARRSAGDARPVIGADTIVVLDGDAIGKPRDRADARQMLSRLAGRTHQVITAYCIVGADDEPEIEAVTTDVTFLPLQADEIDRYLDRADWADKAGAYAVQEHAAYMVKSVAGSYTNVVGLPLGEVVTHLARHLPARRDTGA